MKPEILAIISIFTLFAIIEAIRSSFFVKAGQSSKDVAVEILGAGALLFLTQPLIIVMVYLLLDSTISQYQGALAGLSIPVAFLLFILFDDLTQYWLHRFSHRIPWLYNLHRAHHDAEYMGVRIVYRNGIFYYLIMPGLYFSGALVWLGLGWVYAVYLTIKMTVIIAAHSDACWDKKLYQIPALAPLMWLLERTISTPATHHAHHGKHGDDPATHYKGNYGNLFFFWDVLFGTAKITRGYPQAYGVENLQPVGVAQQLLWPLVRKDGSSVMVKEPKQAPAAAVSAPAAD